MAAYSRVYDSRHLQADCREPGSAPNRQSSTGYLYGHTHTHTHRQVETDSQHTRHTLECVVYTVQCSHHRQQCVLHIPVGRTECVSIRVTDGTCFDMAVAPWPRNTSQWIHSSILERESICAAASQGPGLPNILRLILPLSCDNARDTIDLRRTSNLQNTVRTQGSS